MMSNKVPLVDGFAYVEVRRINTHNKEGEVLKSRSGKRMVSLQWTAVDMVGNVSTIYDYLTEGAYWKITNLQNAINSPVSEDITKDKLISGQLYGRSCGAVIKKDENPEYGSKIVAYVPLAFYNMMEKREEIERQAVDKGAEVVKKLIAPPASSSSKEAKPKGGSFEPESAMGIDEDFIPF